MPPPPPWGRTGHVGTRGPWPCATDRRFVSVCEMATSWGAHDARWTLLSVLLVPLGLLLVLNLAVPRVARAVLRGRLTVGLVGLLMGVHELAYYRPGEKAHALRVRRMYVALHLPSLRARAHGASRVRLVSLCADGVEVRAPAPDSPDAAGARRARKAREADAAHAAARAAHEAHLARLMRDGVEAPPAEAPPGVPPSKEAEATPAAAVRACVARVAKSMGACAARRARLATIVVAQHLLALVTTLVAVDVRNVAVVVPGHDVRVHIDRVVLNGTTTLFYHRRTSAVRAGEGARSDGFHDCPSPSTHPHRSLFGRPEGRTQLQLAVTGVAVTRHTTGAALGVSDGCTMTARVRLAEQLTEQSTQLRLAVHDTTLYVDGLLSLRRAPRTAGPAPPPVPACVPRRTPPRAATWVLSALRSLAVDVDAVHARHTLAAGTLRATVRQAQVEIRNSDPSDAVHQVWFGACGVAGGHHAVRLAEARRIFHLSATVDDAEVHLHGPHPATLLRVRALRSWMRTSATPLGVLATRTAAHGAPAFFADDPNEPTVALYVGIDEIRGAPDLAALRQLVAALPAPRPPPAPAPKPAAPRAAPRAVAPPRVAVVVHVESFVYMVHESRVSLRTPDQWTEPGTVVVVSVPKAHWSIQGSYAERLGRQRAAWNDATHADPPASHVYAAPLGVPGEPGSAPFMVPVHEAVDARATPPPPAPVRHANDGEEEPPGRAPYEPAPLQYRVDVDAGVEVVEVYLSAVHPGSEATPPRVAHDDILYVQNVEMALAARFPALVDVTSWVPRLDLHDRRTRLALSVHRIELDLWQKHVLHSLHRLAEAVTPRPPPQDGTARDGAATEHTDEPERAAPAAADERAPSGAQSAETPAPPLFTRMPRVGLVHLGIGSAGLFLGSSDPNDKPDVRRGVGLLLGQTTLDYARYSKPPRWDALHEASKDARIALRLPEHIGNRARQVAHRLGAGAAFQLVQHDVTLFPIVNMCHARDPGVPNATHGRARHDDTRNQMLSECADHGACCPPHRAGAAEGVLAAGASAAAPAAVHTHNADGTPRAPRSSSPARRGSMPVPDPAQDAHASTGAPNARAAQAGVPDPTGPSAAKSDHVAMKPRYALHVASADAPLDEIAPGAPHAKQVAAEQVEPNAPAAPATPDTAPWVAGEPIPMLPAHEPPRTPDAVPREFFPGALALDEAADALRPGEINVNITPPRTPPRRRATALYASDAWSFDDAFVPLLRAAPYVPRMRQLDPASHMVQVPQVHVDGTCHRPRTDGAAELVVRVRTDGPVSLRVRLLHTYCVLIALAGLLSLRPRGPRRAAVPAASRAPLARGTIEVRAVVPRVYFTALLPLEREVFASISELEVRFRNPRALRVSFALLRGAVPSAQHGLRASWEEMATIRRLAVSWGEQVRAPDTIFVTGDCLHLRIPYAYNTHQLFEAVIVSVKATKQLVFQLVRGGRGSAIYPHGEAPKKLPPISIRMRVACAEAADNAFDSRLALIYLAGSDEQLMRLERERLFALRAKQADNQVPRDEAHERLDALNASLWVRRFQNAHRDREQAERAMLAYLHKRTVDPRAAQYDELPIRLMPTAPDPPLCRMVMTQLCVDVTPPTTFALADTHKFLHEQAGNPEELEYTTLVPLHLRWRVSEASVRLRDYPVPLVHIPPCEDEAEPAKPCFDAEGDLCIAEQIGDDYSVRHVAVTILPGVEGDEGSEEHGLLVPKSVMSPKLYGMLLVHVGTTRPTHIAWGQSMQPAIHDLIRVIDCLTSPGHDPSPKPGPWDKLPLVLQAKLHVTYAGEARLHLKGSRDPYQVSGTGAGWVLSWRDHVELRLGFHNEDQEFLQIVSGEHLLAIPDLSGAVNVRRTGLREHVPSAREHLDAVLMHPHLWHTPPLIKVAWRLRCGVRWGMGLVPERTCTDATCTHEPRCHGAPFYRACRFFGRKPHWEVITRSREGFARLPSEERRDSFAGWRSDFVHLSLSLQAIGDGADLPGGAEAAEPDVHRGTSAVNSLYITPLAWDHFWEWKNLFNSALSLPVRQGPVFPKPPGQKSPKFGRHLATIKYRFNLAPMCLTHMYRQRLRYDLAHGLRTFVGVKARLGTFYLDLHQRMQETVHEFPGSDKPPLRAFHKPMYEIESDLSDLELFCVAAQFREQFASTPGIANDEEDEKFDLFGAGHVDPSETSVEDPMYDPDDYVELDNVPLSDVPPRLRIHEALALARFNFHRRVESRHDYMARVHTPQDAQQHTRSKFGHERTHTCLIGSARAVMDEHLGVVRRQLQHLAADLSAARDVHTTSEQYAAATHARHAEHRARLEEAYARLREHVALIEAHRKAKRAQHTVPQAEIDLMHHAMATGQPAPDGDPDAPDAHVRREWESFNDQLLVYHPVGLLSNDTRDLLLRYYSSSKLHRRFVQRLSVSEQRELRALLGRRAAARRGSDAPEDTHEDPARMLDNLVFETVRLAEEHRGLAHSFSDDFGAESSREFAPDDGISTEYVLRKKTICLCVQPQLVLHSRAGEHATLVFHADQLRVRNYAVSDENYTDASSNRNVLHRNYVAMHSLQGFHSTRALELVANRGLRRLALPYALRMRTRADEGDFRRVMRETNAFMLYDKHNKTRMNDPTRPVLASGRRDDLLVNYLAHHMDLVRLFCPRFAVTATTEQYTAIYTVVTDLLLYTDPYAKEYAQQRSSFAYSYNFDNPDVVIALVAMLQLHCHDLVNLRQAYESRFAHLSPAGRAEYVRISAELLDQYVELCLIEEAVRMSHAPVRDKEKQFALLLQTFAGAIEWNILGDVDAEDKPPSDPLLVRLALERVSFARLGLASGTSTNSVSLGNVQAHNAHPNAYFEEILAKYKPSAHDHYMVPRDMFLSAAWLLLPPAGGIATLDRFEFHLHPVKVQLERKIGKQLMDYLFGHRTQSNDATEVPAPKTRRWLRRLLSHRTQAATGDADTQDDVASVASSLTDDDDDDDDDEDDPDGVLAVSATDHLAQHLSHAPDAPRALAMASLARIGRGDTEFDEVGYANVERVREEMSRRAAGYVSFIQVIFNQLAMCLSYKGDAEHSLTNLYDLEVRTPKLEYANQLGSYRDLADALKKDMIRIAWQNRNTLLKGVMATNNKKRAALKRLRESRVRRYGDSALDVQRQLRRMGAQGGEYLEHFLDERLDSESQSLTHTRSKGSSWSVPIPVAEEGGLEPGAGDRTTDRAGDATAATVPVAASAGAASATPAAAAPARAPRRTDSSETMHTEASSKSKLRKFLHLPPKSRK
ncbi:hypothetical protein MBRA1_003115 [Malassezia brasiliensis]|uniref:Uncharacterized protein n=1 Tax=Malassezia brasiliensis TaxID=1821822 RepID=A0AAF0DVX6_9BASI|nr:hypothetical protein MBRA1_003115 [Malassezia brasiliensis]